MDNAEKKRSITVGIFVALGILVLVATIFTLGGQQKRFVKNIRIKSVFKDVGGLKAGNNVWFSGVKIGTVKSLKFVGNSEVEIEMAIEAAEQKYVRKNAKAKVSSEGMIGNKIIVIYGGTANSAPVEEGDYLKSEEALSTDEMMATLQENNKNMLDITRDFKFLSKRIVRRAAWPERDKINDMMRNESSLISDETKTFLKDAYDHCMQVVDLVESYKDVTTTLIDMNLSIISNRMNEIMKVLTIISSIFIPLTFIAGVYGMNFSYTDPETGKILHLNMPELYSENGYVYTWAVMIFIALVQIIYFWRKGWFK